MRVLIVEDDQKLVSYFKKSFEAEGLSVNVAFNGNVTLDKTLAQSGCSPACSPARCQP